MQHHEYTPVADYFFAGGHIVQTCAVAPTHLSRSWTPEVVTAAKHSRIRQAVFISS
jgi:hypothetical protein